MKACKALHLSSARVGQPKCHLLSSTRFSRRASTEQPRNYASPLVPDSAAAPADQGYAVDSENRTVATAVGDLPLSPVMDPSYWDATTRHHVAKPKSGKGQNSVERQFRKNPYAQALGTPIRRDPASDARLPAFFLQDFNLIAHPKTGHPWWVPRSLTCENPPASRSDEPRIDEPSAKAEGEHVAENSEDSAANSPPTIQPELVRPKGPRGWILARRDLLNFISNSTKMGNSNLTKLPAGMLFGTSTSYKQYSAKAVWRNDMDIFILDRMRRGIVQDLSYFSGLCVEDDRHYIVQCRGWDDVQDKRHGSLLWFEATSGSGNTVQLGDQPGPFATYKFTKVGGATTTTVAVHNMLMLLGPDYVEKVRQTAAVLTEGSLFMLAGRATTNLQLKLWKLQGYLADYESLPRAR
ncbi:hypothetical protein F4808DRAFT_411387 [Astrocystis sublimbata]|nr:hypothetical protein F4808DRAFT_411387 [Astrocystis sublimbata]